MPNWIMYPIPVYSSVKGNSISKIMARVFSKKKNTLIHLLCKTFDGVLRQCQWTYIPNLKTSEKNLIDL